MRADENYFGSTMRCVKVGNTEFVCNLLQKLIPADTFKIQMKKPYSPVYMDCIDEAKRDLRAKARPELVSLPESIDAYDTVILACPSYWGTMPMAVCTFLAALKMGYSTEQTASVLPEAYPTDRISNKRNELISCSAAARQIVRRRPYIIGISERWKPAAIIANPSFSHPLPPFLSS